MKEPKMTTNMELLAHRVEQWAKERGLDNPNNYLKKLANLHKRI